MNYNLIAAEIVRRVHHSPDSAHNLAETVAGLIRAERDRAATAEQSERVDAMREADGRREVPQVNLERLIGKNGFVFVDGCNSPFLVSDNPEEWWLYYWSKSTKCFVTLRRVSIEEVELYREHALSNEKAALYFQA